MRPGVWKAAIVVVGLGLVVALTGCMGGRGLSVAGQEARTDAVVAGTQVEVVFHRVVPGTSTYVLGDDAIFATRDEAAMLAGLHVDNQEFFHVLDGHRVWISLVNHTDTGYLISDGGLHAMVRAGIGYADTAGRAWPTLETAWGHPDGIVGEAFTIPLAPRGRREMVLPVGFMRFDPPEDPQHPGHGLVFPPALRYNIRLLHLRARPIVDGKLGKPIQLIIEGSGTCQVGFDGPM